MELVGDGREREKDGSLGPSATMEPIISRVSTNAIGHGGATSDH